MCEYSQYYEAFVARLVVGEGLTPEQCRCRGGGWILSEVDTWHKCPDHYTNQRHPEDDMGPNEPSAAELEQCAIIEAALREEREPKSPDEINWPTFIPPAPDDDVPF